MISARGQAAAAPLGGEVPEVQAGQLTEVKDALVTASNSLNVATQLLYDLSQNAAASNKYSGPVIGNTVQAALNYRDDLLPHSITMVTNLQRSLEDYIDLPVEVFVRNVADVLEDTRQYKDKAFQLKDLHQKMAAVFKVTASKAEDAVLNAQTAGNAAERNRKRAVSNVSNWEGMGAASGAVAAAGMALTTIATGGAALAVWGPLMVAGGTFGVVASAVGKQNEEQKANGAEVVLHQATYAADVLSNSLRSCIESFITAMNTIAGFFAILEAELTIHASNIDNVKSRHDEGLGVRKLERHYYKVQAKAKELRGACRAYIMGASEVKVNLMAIEIRQTGFYTGASGHYNSHVDKLANRFQEL